MKCKLKFLRGEPFATVHFPPFEVGRVGGIISFKGTLYKILEIVCPVEEFTTECRPQNDDFFISVTVTEVPSL